ncbi:MAG: PEP-CTERM sorting domain-containing protein [Novosphingobium sp.]|nr:PEP-CTERM sorting domain-containing protein [Novosphingobium sp.]MCP5403883.1 PEP-CTERM sorting domain-containing protein [Novosphingobium sp.]
MEVDRILRIFARAGLTALAILFLASPAHAADSVTLTDPNALTLLALGLAGLLIGRRAAARRKQD